MMLASLLLLAAPQSTWYVDDSGAAPGSGTQGDPYTSIAYALAQPLTQSGDTVEVAAGTYLDEVIDFLGKAVHLIGVDGPTQTVVLGAPALPGFDCSIIRCVSGEGAGTVIEGLTLRDGFGSFVALSPLTARAGGALFVDGSSPRVRNCRFEGNAAFYGACIFVRNGQPQVDECEFHNTRAVAGPTGNYAGWALYSMGGGAILRDSLVDGKAPALDGSAIYYENGNLLIERCDLRGNWKSSSHFNGGGAIHAIDATVFIVDSAVLNNYAYNVGGGAIRQHGGALYITRSEFRSNRVFEAHGGALNLSSSFCRIEDTEFIDNRAGDSFGGAIYSEDYSVHCFNVNFEANTAGDGGAIYAGSALSISDSMFRDNSISDVYGSSNGGAILCGTAVIRGSIFSGNEASNDHAAGGAIYGSASTQVYSSTFIDNSSMDMGGSDGGAVFNAQCQNSVFWNNGPNPISGNSIISYSLVQYPQPGTGNVSTDPRFWGPADVHLRPGSPAINAGNPASPLDPDGSRADMGALPFDPWYCGPGCSGSVGLSVCASFANSTGHVGALAGLGSDLVASNLLILNGTRLPMNTVGYMLAARSPGFVPLFGGSNGVLCLGGPILRFSSTVLQSGPGALMSTQLNLAAFPQGEVVTPGDTWYFQLWYRDTVSGVAGSNTTQALRVEFR
jgi:predicted outer membrane repeat protein